VGADGDGADGGGNLSPPGQVAGLIGEGAVIVPLLCLSMAGGRVRISHGQARAPTTSRRPDVVPPDPDRDGLDSLASLSLQARAWWQPASPCNRTPIADSGCTRAIARDRDRSGTFVDRSGTFGNSRRRRRQNALGVIALGVIERMVGEAQSPDHLWTLHSPTPHVPGYVRILLAAREPRATGRISRHADCALGREMSQALVRDDPG
jgi:hypothetical protein